MTTIAIAYIPVLHQGYYRFLTEQSAKIDHLVLLTRDTIPAEIEYLKKELRALPVERIQRAIESWGVVNNVEIATLGKLRELAATLLATDKANRPTIIMPDDDITEAVVKMYFPLASAAIQRSPIFLRWDKKTAVQQQNVHTEHIMVATEFIKTMFSTAYQKAGLSTDWWRHYGCVITRNGEPVITAFNRHLPTEQQPYIDGDARGLFHAGEHIDLVSAIHGEADAIAHCAKEGVALEGCEMYATIFPCPTCAKLIAAAGIKKLYFSEGYAMFDGELILKDAGVELIKVELPPATRSLADRRTTVVPYPQA